MVHEVTPKCPLSLSFLSNLFSKSGSCPPSSFPLRAGACGLTGQGRRTRPGSAAAAPGLARASQLHCGQPAPGFWDDLLEPSRSSDRRFSICFLACSSHPEGWFSRLPSSWHIPPGPSLSGLKASPRPPTTTRTKAAIPPCDQMSAHHSLLPRLLPGSLGSAGPSSHSCPSHPTRAPRTSGCPTPTHSREFSSAHTVLPRSSLHWLGI